MAKPLQNPFDLSDRVAIVTGANRGIGLGIAQGLSQAGAQVAIWARDEEAGRQAANQINEEGGVEE